MRLLGALLVYEAAGCAFPIQELAGVFGIDPGVFDSSFCKN